MARSIQTGASYFGNRTPRHVRADMQDMAESGLSYVVHCFRENDLRFGLETMRELVGISKDAGLEVWMDPWGVANIFGGEAESFFVAAEPDACQVLADGARVGAACLNQPALRRFVRGWTAAAVEIGADVLFWDEPHWYPGDLWFYGEQRGNADARWSCRCEACLELFAGRYGHDMPVERDAEVEEFRHQCALEALTEFIGHGHERGVRNALCLLPKGIPNALVQAPDWTPYARIPGLDIFGTDPYWAVSGLDLEGYVRPNARAVRALCDAEGLRDQFWIQGYRIPAGREPEVGRAVEIAVEERMTSLAVWSYRSCESMSALHSDDNEAVWRTVVEAFAKARGGA